MHYIIKTKIEKEFKETNLSYTQILQNQIKEMSFIREHYISIIHLFKQLKETNNTCFYNELKKEIEICNRRITLLSINKDYEKFSEMLKTEKNNLIDFEFWLSTSKKEKDYMIVYHYDRFLLSLNKSKNFINSQIRQLNKTLYSLYN